MRLALAAATLGLMLGACSTAPETPQAAATPDPRQGKEVSQICFQSQIRSWKEHDRKSIIVERGIRDEYKLDLIGTCQPDQAFLNIGLISRGGSSCLSKGDQLRTDAQFDGQCSISRIYEWNKNATPAAASAAAPGGAPAGEKIEK
jgi:hypothetical protein